MRKVEIFEVGEKVKVVDINNASQFNTGVGLKGVYLLDDWKDRVFTIDKTMHTFTVYNKKQILVYRLLFEDVFVGAVYETVLEKYVEPKRGEFGILSENRFYEVLSEKGLLSEVILETMREHLLSKSAAINLMGDRLDLMCCFSFSKSIRGIDFWNNVDKEIQDPPEQVLKDNVSETPFYKVLSEKGLISRFLELSSSYQKISKMDVAKGACEILKKKLSYTVIDFGNFSFDWEETDEGADFWLGIYNKIDNYKA